MGNSKDASSHNPGRDRLLGYLLGLAGVIIFSGTLPATRLAVASYHPWFITFGRAAIAAAAAAVCLAIMRRRFPRDHLGQLVIVGLTLIFGFPGFMALAMQTVPSSHGGVVLGILPLATALFAALLAGERPSVFFWICGLVGAALITVFALRDSGWDFQAGDLWLLAAGFTAAWGYVVSGKLSHHMPGWEVICWALLLYSPAILGGTLLLWQPGLPAAPLAHNIAFAYLGLFSMFIGFFAWNRGLRLGGMARIGQLQLLQTFFTLAIAAVVLGETITLETIAFAVAVLVVVVAGLRARVGTS